MTAYSASSAALRHAVAGGVAPAAARQSIHYSEAQRVAAAPPADVERDGMPFKPPARGSRKQMSHSR
jgi:hypothetical protein